MYVTKKQHSHEQVVTHVGSDWKGNPTIWTTKTSHYILLSTKPLKSHKQHHVITSHPS